MSKFKAAELRFQNVDIINTFLELYIVFLYDKPAGYYRPYSIYKHRYLFQNIFLDLIFLNVTCDNILIMIVNDSDVTNIS